MAEDKTGTQGADWQEPTEEEIRKRAYELYRERERECGGPLDDWLEAEAELLMLTRLQMPSTGEMPPRLSRFGTTPAYGRSVLRFIRKRRAQRALQLISSNSGTRWTSSRSKCTAGLSRLMVIARSLDGPFRRPDGGATADRTTTTPSTWMRWSSATAAGGSCVGTTAMCGSISSQR